MDAPGRRVVRRPVGRSDINDAEIAGYIHSEKEFQFRKIVWEMMYKGRHDKKNPKERRKRTRKEKKKEAEVSDAAARKTDNKERPLSSKINYDVLRKLMEEDGDQDQRDSGLSYGGGGGVLRQESSRRAGGYGGGGGGEEGSGGSAVGGDSYGYDAFGDGEEGCGYRYDGGGDDDDVGGDYEGF